jgi:hypothetical protein
VYRVCPIPSTRRFRPTLTPPESGQQPLPDDRTYEIHTGAVGLVFYFSYGYRRSRLAAASVPSAPSSSSAPSSPSTPEK